ILAALGYMIYAGVTQSAVYFVTPSELRASPVTGKAYRLGGLVARGSLRWDARTLDLAFTLTDGQASIPVRHKGTAPDLFGDGRGWSHGPAGLRRVRATRRAGRLRADHVQLRAPRLRVPHLRFLRPLRRAQYQPGHAVLVSHHGRVGSAGGLDHPVGLDAVALH